jgi:hypothetical protein
MVDIVVRAAQQKSEITVHKHWNTVSRNEPDLMRYGSEGKKIMTVADGDKSICKGNLCDLGA